MIKWIDSYIQGGIIPLHLLSLLHVDLHRASLSGSDASHAEDDQEHEESNADDGNHRNSCACHIYTWLTMASVDVQGSSRVGFNDPPNTL